MTHHACACGTKLPDRRSKQCNACRGAAVKAQDLARTLRKMKAWQDSIWWLYFANALKVAVFALHGSDYPDAKTLRRICNDAGIRIASFDQAWRAEPIDRRSFNAICKSFGFTPAQFIRAQEVAA